MDRNMKRGIWLLALGIAIGVGIFAPWAHAQTSTQQPGIPSQLITYGLQHPGVKCVEGTLDPLTIHTCPTEPDGTLELSQGGTVG